MGVQTLRNSILFVGALIVAGLIGGCTTPRVNFVAQTSPVSDFNDAGVSFRIPRSQISIAPKAGTNPAVFVATVIDPVPTSGPVPLPLNEGNALYYTLSYTPPDPTGFTSQSFGTLIKSGPQQAWPIPTCGTATVTLLTSNKKATLPDLTWAATPTELDYPTEAGKPSTVNSTLYRATGIDDLRSTTALKITYVPNTKIVSTIGVTVTDHVVDDITTITTIATAAAAFAAVAPPPEVPTPTLTLTSQTIRVADNRVLDAMTLPSNGSISMNPVCGADRTDSSTGGPSTIATDLGKIATAAQSTYAAWTKKSTAAAH